MPAPPNLLPETAAFLARRHQLLVGGEWSDAQRGATLITINPADEKPLAEFAVAGPEDVDLAVDAARKALESSPWARLGPANRGALLWQLADAIETHAAVFAQLEVLDNGMPLNPAASMSAPGAAKMLRYYAGWPTKIMGRTIPSETPPGAGQPSLIYTRREPVGVVAQIIPWNYPLGMAAMKLGPALAAGCTVILKPDEQTPLSALLLGELVRQVGFPPGVVNVLPGEGSVAGAALAEHAGVDKIAFTGSTATGKSIVRAAAGNLKRVSLELGGKAPFIIFPDADLDRAIATAARLGFFLQGQNCQCPSRLIVHTEVYDRVVEAFVAATRSLKIGPGWDPDTRMGPLISAKQLDRVAAYIDSGVNESASLVTGGRRIEGAGFFLEPTVFIDAGADMRITREEIFGPVITIQRCDDDELDAISAVANDTNYGLVASVWTRDLRVAHGLAERIKSGVVGINHHGSADIYAPFGGYKESGWAREFGPDSLEPYLETKSVVVRYD